MKRVVLGVIFVLLALGSSEAQIQFQRVADGFGRPLEVINDGVNPGIYVVDQNGSIFYYESGSSTEIADLSNLITRRGNEQGLLGMAFHPAYPMDNRVFIYYTELSDDIVIASLVQDIDSKELDESTLRVILQYEQPFRNHNGGCLRFGPDGYLYIGTGDGGAAGDPNNLAQNLMEPLGKMLRIDIDTDDGSAYRVPDDNPFEDDDFALNEIWSYGLRNPWRFSFDKNSGDLWIGDVGQDAREEINRQLAASAGGENYGWRCKEGFMEFEPDDCDLSTPGALTDPLFDYAHPGNGCSVTGGVISYSRNAAEVYGTYVYGDICSNNIWSLDFSGTEPVNELIGQMPVGGPSTFGTDMDGRLYTASLVDGSVYEIVGTTVSNDELEKAQITIYPTVVNSQIFIEGLDQSNAAYRILTLNGQVVLSSIIKDRVLDVADLAAGIYILSVEVSDVQYNFRFIKN